MSTTPVEQTLARTINVDQTHPILLMCYDPADGKWWPVKGTQGILQTSGGGGGGGVTDGDYGDITVSAGATVWTIDIEAVTNDKLALMPAGTLKGNNLGVTGTPLDLTATEVRTVINVADGATANSPDVFLLSRANHTDTQAIATVSGLQAALDSKQPNITAGTAAQYYRGDKVFVTLDKASVGLGNVDNTSDVNKPVSTAQAAAIALVRYSVPCKPSNVPAQSPAV